jgi:hypothetical protein
MPRIDFASDSCIKGGEYDDIFELLDEMQVRSKAAGCPAISHDDPQRLRVGWQLINPTTGEEFYWFIRLPNLKRSWDLNPGRAGVREMLGRAEGRVQIAVDLFER